MKRKVFFICLVLTLALTLATPVPALAAKPVGFSTIGEITDIDDGDVSPAGNSGRWIVKERTVEGNLLVGDITGGFVLTYKANVESVWTQAGNFHGTMVVNDGDYTIKVNGSSSPGTTPIGPTGLVLSGHWTFKGNNQGNGGFDAWVIPMLDEEGHITGIFGGGIEMTGQWKP